MAELAVVLPLKDENTRIPDKNFCDLGGKPLYRWSLDKVLQMYEVYIFGTREVWFRVDPEVRDHCLWIEEESPGYEDGMGFDVVVANVLGRDHMVMMIHATAPFIAPETYRTCVEAMGTHDSACTAIRHIGKFWTQNGERINGPANFVPLTQNTEPIYQESDALWVYNTNLVLDHRRRIGFNPYFHVVEHPESLDINWEEDLIEARRIVDTSA